MNRCTISHHRINSRNEHLDIFFETQNYLETYEVPEKDINELFSQKKIICSKKEPHRKVYLDYEGEISNHRGFLKILWKGYFLNAKKSFPEQLRIFMVDHQYLRLEF